MLLPPVLVTVVVLVAVSEVVLFTIVINTAPLAGLDLPLPPRLLGTLPLVVGSTLLQPPRRARGEPTDLLAIMDW